ncbi:MAG: hypothetical protein IJ862_03350 [Selenomonadaceae bacterium]|nr:hypothetical protein [Selenomonadaceae bacterium]
MENETMIHPETREFLRRDVRAIDFTYKRETIVMNMPGWYPPEDDDGIFSMEDMKVHDKALDILKARHKKSLKKKVSTSSIRF